MKHESCALGIYRILDVECRFALLMVFLREYVTPTPTSAGPLTANHNGLLAARIVMAGLHELLHVRHE